MSTPKYIFYVGPRITEELHLTRVATGLSYRISTIDSKQRQVGNNVRPPSNSDHLMSKHVANLAQMNDSYHGD